MNATLENPVSNLKLPLEEIIRQACKRIPPLWSLKNFVAVNPFLGLAERHFMEALCLIQRVGHGEMLMPNKYYLERVKTGRIQETHFHAAIKLAALNLPSGWAEQLDFKGFDEWKRTLQASDGESAARKVLTFADYLDQQTGSGWSAFIVEEISKWCSAYFDQGQSSWRMPWRNLGLFAAWKAAAQLDANAELTGLKKFRYFVATLPGDPLEVIGLALEKLGVPKQSQPDFLHRQLMSLPGWSSYVQYLVREKGMAGVVDGSLQQLLAIRMAYELSLLQQSSADPAVLGGWERQVANPAGGDETVTSALLAKYVAQQALEIGYQQELMAKLRGNRTNPAGAEQKSLQAIFCIDVRSEVFRRSLEAQSDEIETIGFAGFFGIAMEYLKFGQSGGAARCPVLLNPRIKVREACAGVDAKNEGRLLRQLNFRQTINGAWNSFKSSAISCFSFVETAGLWFGVKLVKDSLWLPDPNPVLSVDDRRQSFGPKIEHEVCCLETHGHQVETGIDLADQITLAAAALKNMGLTSNFAKVVLICGHGSTTRNNPYGSALDCGACGGHSGDVNARIASEILNNPAVRAGLKRHEIHIPEGTVFIAGLHNTTTDEVLIYDENRLLSNQIHAFGEIKAWIAAASKRARCERAASLGLVDGAEPGVREQIFQRSRDWSQVRPEWGLAGNAAFIAAPRERTKGLNLGGRVFLHNYRCGNDPDNSILELIMLAPMVVASWINLQYYGSTVDNRLFGSGNKALHNVVGTFGVWQGNGGDLQPGLPMQSLHDGTNWMHEPLRLSVFIEAEPATLEKVIVKHAVLRELVQNGWVNLFALGADGQTAWRYCGNQFVAEID